MQSYPIEWFSLVNLQWEVIVIEDLYRIINTYLLKQVVWIGEM